MLSNNTRDAVMEKFGVDIGVHNEDAGDNVIDFTDDDVDQDKYMKNISDIKFEINNYIEIKKEENFDYKGLKLLIAEEPSVRKGETVYLCNYNINSQLKLPFLLFNLYKYENDVIGFPKIVYRQGSIVDTIKENIEKVYHYWDVNVEYVGFIRYKDNVYMWYKNIYNKENNIIQGEKKDKWWNVLVSEIINERKVLNFNIDPEVTRFFLENIDFVYMENQLGKTLESPNVQYYGNYYKRIAYTAALGHEREIPGSSMGPYYYFGTYLRGLRYALWSSYRKPMKINDEVITINDEGLFSRGGLVRFVIFAGKHTMLLGRETDEKDNVGDKSEYKFKRAHLRDEGGKWIDDYDSIGLGIYKIDDREYEPQITVKSFEQQYPLSYYYIDTKQVLNNVDLKDIIIE
jgi:hypothetical protein